MTETTASLQSQLEALNTARARGVRSVSYEGKSTQFGSDAAMQAAQLDLERRIASMTNVTGRTVRISSSKGLDRHDEG